MDKIKKIIESYRAAEIEADISSLPEDIIKALPHIRNAMDVITEIFILQQNEDLPDHYKEVMSSSDETRKQYYSFFKGPYNELENFKSEFSGIPDRRKGCAFYPDTLSDSEITDKIMKLSPEELEKARDHYSVVREKGGGLVSIPYHVYYSDLLSEAASELRNAAGLISHSNLRSYLLTRAETLLSGDYRKNDSEWVRLTDSPIDIVIGPYEVYADALMGLKATYESMLMIVDHEKCSALKEIESNIDKLSELFPLPAGSVSAFGGSAPVVVVNQIYAAGEASSGVMPAAFNLPNDSWVRGNVGWKQVMIYNVMKAKFNTATKAIAQRVLDKREKISFDPLFTFVLLHEISHGLGPAYRKSGEEVSKALSSFYSTIEEAKADTGALYLILKAGGRYGIEKYDERVLLASYLSALFRSVRFGIHEAHGLANVIQLNWFAEKGNIETDSGIYKINSNGILESSGELLDKLCSLEASGTLKETEDFIERYGKPDKSLLSTLEKLEDIPVDIRAVFPDF